MPTPVTLDDSYREDPKPDAMLEDDDTTEDDPVEQLVTVVEEQEEIMTTQEDSKHIDDLATALSEMKLMVVDTRAAEDMTMCMVVLHPNASSPTLAHGDDAGYDVTLPNTIVLPPYTTTKVPLGIAAEALPGTFIKIEG
ncbi:hypothetical protein GGI09_003524 [Coemansia sp. S100]|nr:hypothetical protein GGI09_003524 [Coemansia sp. S100]